MQRYYIISIYNLYFEYLTCFIFLNRLKFLYFLYFKLHVVELTEDDVYFPDVSKLDEYVLNDSGVIFNGDAKYVGQKPWFYGQVSCIY